MVGRAEFAYGLGEDRLAHQALLDGGRVACERQLRGQRVREIVVVDGLLAGAIEPRPRLQRPVAQADLALVEQARTFQQGTAEQGAGAGPVVEVHRALRAAVGAVNREVTAPVAGLGVVISRLLAADIAIDEIVTLACVIEALLDIAVRHQPSPPVEAQVLDQRRRQGLAAVEADRAYLGGVKAGPAARGVREHAVNPLRVFVVGGGKAVSLVILGPQLL